MTIVTNMVSIFIIIGIVLAGGIFIVWIQTNDSVALHDYNQDLYQRKFVIGGFDAALQTTIPPSGYSLQHMLANVAYYYPTRGDPKDLFVFTDFKTGEDREVYAYTETTKIFDSSFGPGNWYLYVLEEPDIKLGTLKEEEKRIAAERLIPKPYNPTDPLSGRYNTLILWVYEVKVG